MLAITSAFAVWQLSRYEAHQLLLSMPYPATWTSNIHFAFTAFDYFNELAARDLFLHTWSLGVEEQFYLVWPFLVGVTFLMRWRWLVSLGAVLALSLAVSLYWSLTSPHLAFYLMPSRVWQFALGAMVFLWQEASPGRACDICHTSVVFWGCSLGYSRWWR